MKETIISIILFPFILLAILILVILCLLSKRFAKEVNELFGVYEWDEY